MGEQWQVETDGKRLQVVDQEELLQWFRDGRLRADRRVRRRQLGWLEARLAPPFRELFQRREERFFMTTETMLPDYRIIRRLEVISAECAFGIDSLRGILEGIDFSTGGRNHSIQRDLRKARRTCLQELRAEANSLGADAVIGVSLAYSEISSLGKALFLGASGTAVLLVEKD